jgi:RimJ/RimL family protein N-acetyltransferase
MDSVILKNVQHSDLDHFFRHVQDKEAQYMAAFVSKDPSNREAFDAHWQELLDNPQIVVKTIHYQGKIVGHIAKFVMFNEPELTYWIAREFWGIGIATTALKLFLEEVTIRPIYARAATDNQGSIRVLEKSGFEIAGKDKGFANARGKVIEEIIMKLDDETI